MATPPSPSPEVYEFLEAEDFSYAIRLPANKVLQGSIAHLLKRPVGRPPNDVRRYYANFSYQAGSWNKKRRVVAKVEWHPGELYPRVGLDPLRGSSVTNLSRPAERVVRSTISAAPPSNGSRKARTPSSGPACPAASSTTMPSGSSCMHWPITSATSCAPLALPDSVEQWSLTTLREKLIKIGAKIVRHGLYVIFQMAEVAIPRDLLPTSSAESIGSERRPSQHDDRIVPHA